MKKTFSDEQLVRFLDGQLDDEKAHEIQTALSTDPELAAQLDALLVDTGGIREAFDRTLPLAPAIDLAVLAEREQKGSEQNKQTRQSSQSRQSDSAASDSNRITRFLPIAASVVVALGVGLLAGLNADRLFNGGSKSAGGVTDWQQAVVDYQQLYVPSTLPATAPGDTEKRQQLTTISRASGLSVTEAMVMLPGIDFRRAQTLGIDGAPLIQIAFAGVDGEPFALCFTQIDQPASEPVAKVIDGMNTVSWGNGKYGFILASFASAEQVGAAASKAIELF
jgi:anti-sigma factor RsiW